VACRTRCCITRLAHGSLQDERVTALATPKLVRGHGDRLRRPPNRHVLVPANDVGWIPSGFSIEFEGRQCAQQLSHSHACFEFRQRHPDAEMNPFPEGEVPTPVTVENQLIRTVKFPRITVGGGENHHLGCRVSVSPDHSSVKPVRVSFAQLLTTTGFMTTPFIRALQLMEGVLTVRRLNL